ncbi:MAG: helix-turn-helix transcriptional regulator [Selenomonadaceae bacterium]|nr:helix-turn-helix transcriptional regulator [Selenomonadaceae bacterium]
MRLGQIIRDYRNKNDLSMGDFARLSGISKPYVSMLEANKNSSNGKPIVPSVGTLQKVSRAIKISLNDLLRMLDDEKICVKTENLSEEQITLLSSYDNLPDESKRLIMEMMGQLGRKSNRSDILVQTHNGSGNAYMAVSGGKIVNSSTA